MKIDIQGLDTKRGLDLYDDDEEIYLAVLRSYSTNIPTTLNKLRNVSAETLPTYMIGIHGLKGTSANIGAEDIRAKATELEKMAKSGDLAGVQARNEAFLKEAEKLVSDIKAWLDKNDPGA